MATLTSPEHSFVKLHLADDMQVAPDLTGCSDPYSFNLPVFYKDDYKFQFIIDGTRDDLNTFFDIAVQPTSRFAFTIVDRNTIPLYEITPQVEIKRVSATQAVLNWMGDFGLDFDNLDPDKCFRIRLQLLTLSGSTFYYSSIFQKILPECYFSLLEFYGTEDNFGYSYCNSTFNNKVRVPFYLNKPQFPFEEEVYVKANGEKRTTALMIKKEFEGTTEYMPAEVHESLAVALKHDFVHVISENLTGGFQINGTYEIEWPNANFPLSPAKFKGYDQDFTLRKSTCADCKPYSELTLVDDYLGDVIEGQELTYNVFSNDFIYCALPFTIITYVNNEFVESYIHAVESYGIHFKLRPSLNSEDNVLLFKYMVHCDGETATASVFANIRGTAQLTCPVPTGLTSTLITAAEFPVEYQFAWTAPDPGTVEDYFWSLHYATPGQPIITSGNTSGNTVNVNHLPYATALVFKIQHICSTTLKSSFAELPLTTFTKPATASGWLTANSGSVTAMLARPFACTVAFYVSGQGVDGNGLPITWNGYVTIPAGQVSGTAIISGLSGTRVTCINKNDPSGYKTALICGGVETLFTFLIGQGC